MSLDPIIMSAFVAMATAVSTLWIQVRRQIADLRSQVADLVSRLRCLEDKRLEEAKKYATNIRDIVAENSSASRALADSLRSLRCLAEAAK